MFLILLLVLLSFNCTSSTLTDLIENLVEDFSSNRCGWIFSENLYMANSKYPFVTFNWKDLMNITKDEFYHCPFYVIEMR